MSDFKIATLTFHRAINYGAVLQTYALQKSIEKFGYNSEVLDYRSDFLETLHNPHDIHKYKSILHYFYAILKNRVKRDNRKSFRDFQKRYINISELYTKNSIKKAEYKYDAFIVGSDQVWNYNCTDFDKTFFLDFVCDKRKKYSYAASLGIKLNDENIRKEYKTLLSDFSVLSVRELQAQKELETLELSSEVSVDPTLLLSVNEWRSIAQQPKFKTSKYVLVYVIVATSSIFKIAKKIAKKYDLEVVYINEFMFNKVGVKNVNKITPNEWLWLFDNAEYIVTNSFHGTAFSLNLEKQFYVELLPINTNVNSRLTDILNEVGLSDRIIEDMSQIQEAHINYDNIHIDKLRNDSLSFLQKLLEGIENG